jgi:hypothetical protein
MDRPRHQQDVKIETTSEYETDGVVLWRRRQLAESGFSLPLATRVARDGRFDVHALIELVERGCDPETAVRILAPLEDVA